MSAAWISDKPANTLTSCTGTDPCLRASHRSTGAKVHDATSSIHRSAPRCVMQLGRKTEPMDLGTWLAICLRGRLIGSDVLGTAITWKNHSVAAACGPVAGWRMLAKRRPRQYPRSGTVGCITPSTRHCRKPASIPGRSHIFRTPRARSWAIARRAMTIAAVIEPPRMAITRPGRRAVSGAVPRSW